MALSHYQLASRAGETSLHARISERMQPGVVYTTFHHPVTGANVVTTENSDWATNCPEYKVTAVQVGVANARGDEELADTGGHGVPVSHAIEGLPKPA